MKRRSLFAGLLAAFVPVVPVAVAAKPAGTAVDAILKDASAHSQKMAAFSGQVNQYMDQMRADIDAVGYTSINFSHRQAEMDALVASSKANLERSRLIAELGVSSVKVYEDMAQASIEGMNRLVG